MPRVPVESACLSDSLKTCGTPAFGGYFFQNGCIGLSTGVTVAHNVGGIPYYPWDPDRRETEKRETEERETERRETERWETEMQ